MLDYKQKEKEEQEGLRIKNVRKEKVKNYQNEVAETILLIIRTKIGMSLNTNTTTTKTTTTTRKVVIWQIS